jgi:hypothetical protein
MDLLLWAANILAQKNGMGALAVEAGAVEGASWIGKAQVETTHVGAAQLSTIAPITGHMTTALIIHPQATLILVGLSLSIVVEHGLAQEHASSPGATTCVEHAATAHDTSSLPHPPTDSCPRVKGRSE